MSKRDSVVIEPRDQKAIFDALERWAATGDFVALRTRGFVYVLADGAVRTKTAAALDIEEVAKETAASRIVIVNEVTQRPCEGNNYRGRKFLLTDRSREAIADYLKVARDEGWLANAGKLQGPLWIATHHRGSQQRMSQRTASHAWNTFLHEKVQASREIQLDDLVITGRLAFLTAAQLSTEVLSEHTGLSQRSAAHYRDHLLSTSSSTAREIVSELNKKHRQHKSKRGG